MFQENDIETINIKRYDNQWLMEITFKNTTNVFGSVRPTLREILQEMNRYG